QRPLYYSNQNHRFLHGLAHAGIGCLREDWLANTTDPTPLFSLLVEGTYYWGHESLFYAYHVLLMAVYVGSLVGIARVVLGPKVQRAHLAVFAALFVFVHSMLVNSWLGRGYASDVG